MERSLTVPYPHHLPRCTRDARVTLAVLAGCTSAAAGQKDMHSFLFFQHAPVYLYHSPPWPPQTPGALLGGGGLPSPPTCLPWGGTGPYSSPRGGTGQAGRHLPKRLCPPTLAHLPAVSFYTARVGYTVLPHLLDMVSLPTLMHFHHWTTCLLPLRHTFCNLT